MSALAPAIEFEAPEYDPVRPRCEWSAGIPSENEMHALVTSGRACIGCAQRVRKTRTEARIGRCMCGRQAVEVCCRVARCQECDRQHYEGGRVTSATLNEAQRSGDSARKVIARDAGHFDRRRMRSMFDGTSELTAMDQRNVRGLARRLAQ